MAHGEQMAPTMRLGSLVERLQRRFDGLGCEVLADLEEVTLVVPAAKLLQVAIALRDEPAFAFAQLTDLCGLDYAAYGQSEWDTENATSSGFGRGVDRDQMLPMEGSERFAVVIHLLSMTHNLRLRLRVFATGEPPLVDSLVDVWNSANWFEREAFDLFGILFREHPDLRRILTDYGFIGHPFRKDFPLIGQVEMRYDPVKGRVIYEPVAIEPRTLVPRVIRSDNCYFHEAVKQN